MFSKDKRILGLDIGTSSVKIVQLVDSRKGLELKAIAIKKLPSEVVVEGEIMDVNVVVDTIKHLLKEHNIKVRNVAAAVLSRSIIVKKIKVPRTSIEDLEESIYTEAEQYIPFDIEEVNLAFQVVENEEDYDSEVMDVLLIVVKKEKVNDVMNMVTESGLISQIVDVDGFAIRNQYELNNDIEDGRIVALIDIGASITNIIILEGDSSVFTRDISVGGNSYTKAIQKSFSLSFEQAETLKMGEDLDEVSHDNIEPVVQQVNDEIVNEIQGALDYFKATYGDKNIDKIALSGGCASIPGFSEFLEEKLGIPVEIANPLKNIHCNEKKFDSEYLAGIAPMFAVTIGLALRRIGDR